MRTQYDPPIGAGARETPALTRGVRRRDLSRRDALRLGALGAGGGMAALLTACGGGGKAETAPTVGPDEMVADAAAMASLLELERTAGDRLRGGGAGAPRGGGAGGAGGVLPP